MPVRCPFCSSYKMQGFGQKWSGGKKKQRYQCQACGMTTVNPKGTPKKGGK